MEIVLILMCIFCLVTVYITSKNQSKSSINKSKTHKATKTNNCNGCPKQETCKYGYYTYDEFDKRQLALWEKFMMLSILENNSNTKKDFIDRPEEINEYINKYSQQNKFNIEDVEWLEKYLNYEQQNLKQYIEFGKCGKAYVKYMKLDYLVKDIKLKLKDIRVSN